MCRDKDHGGRRCPSSEYHERSAYRTRHRARVAADGACTDSVDERTEGRKPAYNPTQIANLADRVGFALSSPLILDADDAARWEKNRADLVSTYGSLEGASTHIGDVIRQEAERRAGVDPDAVIAQATDAHRRLKSKYDEDAAALLRRTNTELEAINAQIRAINADQSLTRDERNQQRTAATDAFHERKQRHMRYAEELCDEFRSDYDEHVTQVYRDGHTALANAYREVLSEVRPLGGVDLNWHSRTTKEARTAFNEAADTFPTDWLNRANEMQPPVAKVQRTRAHYSRGAVHSTKKRVPVVATTWASADDPDEWCKSRSNAYEDYEVDTQQMIGASGDLGKHFPVIVRQYEVRHTEGDTPPKGRGWVKYGGGYGLTTWRRPRTHMNTIDAELAPEIKTSRSTPNVSGRSDTYATCTHELAHRMEHVVPEITTLEREFLHRRTSGGGEKDQLQQIYPGTREVGYADNFPLHYSGRVYGDANEPDSGNHYELLSTGTEALFGGNHGGFVGMHGDGTTYSRDDDFRSFVLGVFATVARND